MAYPATTEHHKLYPYTSIMASPYSGDPTGVIDCAAAIESIKANQSNTGTIFIPKGTFRIGTNLSIPVGMTLEFAAAAYFTIDAGVTLTIPGPINAPDGQSCFIGAGVLSLGTVFPSTDTTKILQPGTWAITSDTTIPANVVLRPRKGAVLVVATTKTLTINGPIEAGLYQIFSCVGTGKVVFPAGSTVYSSWFASLTEALTCVGSVKTRLEITKSETVSADSTINANTTLVGFSGNVLTIATGKTLTLNGTVDAGAYQIFSLTGTGKVVFGTGSVSQLVLEWWGTDATAMQDAIDCAAASTCKKIVLSGDAYTFSTPINVTSTASVDRSGIVVQGLGRRGGTTIYADTGDILFELTGSNYTAWRDIYIVHGPSTPSTVAFFMATTATKTSCQYNDFSRTYVELYKADITGLTYGTIGYLVVGSEENTWDKTQTYATTPFFFTSGYSGLATEYPSYFLTGDVIDHSCGVNTFSGENLAVTYDMKGSNIVLYGTNSIDFGNMYLSNVNVGAAGSVVSGINSLGGTLEGLRGKFKMESKSTLIELDGGNVWGWDVSVKFGAVADATVSNPVVLINADAASVLNLQDFKLNVAYVDPTDTPFVGKKIFDITGTPNLTPVLGNIKITVNQTQAEYAAAPFPGWFCGLTRNFKLKWADSIYTMDANRHNLTLAANRIYLGLGDETTPTNIAQVIMPTLVVDHGAMTMAIRVKGMLTNNNTNSAGSDTEATSCLFDTSRGAWAVQDGAVTAGAGTSDDLMNDIAATAVSDDAATYQFTGVNMGLTYDAGPPRLIQIDALPVGTGTSLASVLSFIHSGEIEMLYVGTLQELIYLQ